MSGVRLGAANSTCFADGKPQAELFLKDGLHLNEKGYALWSDMLRPYLK